MNSKHPKTYTTTFDVHLPATKDQPGRFLETIEVEVFRSFGEEVLTPESSEKVERIKARHLGLMTGADIKAMRERLKLSQKQLTALLQCGEKTLSHWENGHGHPTGLSNTILRLLDEGFIAPEHLLAVSQPRRRRAAKPPGESRPATQSKPPTRAEPAVREDPKPDRTCRTQAKRRL